MKIHILYEFSPGPWGGGNQFLKQLKGYFVEAGVYVDDPRKADIILFNSDQKSIRASLRTLCTLARTTNAVIVNRVDGPIALRNAGFESYDKVVTDLNNALFDGCIFQSQWSSVRMQGLAGAMRRPFVVIHNAADQSAYYPRTNVMPANHGKVKIVATSWSKNYRAKGFDIYEYLDKHLDFSRYAMTFVGNSPIQFKNIRMLEPVDAGTLGAILREHDIYITASVNDPCSNALIEGLACGLPAVVRNSGGHPELMGDGGVTFNDADDVIRAIDTVAGYSHVYKACLPVHSFVDRVNEYITFFRRLASGSEKQRRNTDRLSLAWLCFSSSARLRLYGLRHSISKKIESTMKRIFLRGRSCCRIS